MNNISQKKWKNIWNKRKIVKELKTKITLADLIEADGFDTGATSYREKSWRTMVRDFCNRVTFNEDSNVLEIGCGCGAFLYACNEIVKANYFGIDFSRPLIEIAKKQIPRGHFVVSEANELTFKNTKFDLILSHGVFIYFPSHQYVEKVLKKYTERIVAGGKLALMDLNDSKRKKDYHSFRKSMYKNPDDYEKDYEGLQHLFFEKNEIEKYLKSLGMDKFKYFPHAVSSYGNADFRFNLICEKI
tara:strand:+ start:5740 stop:6471 length:732 start_codon:yes stop_codon:yes gene_type:complete